MVLKRLVDDFGLVALKVGTEVEDMDVDFIGRVAEMAKAEKVPLWFKIGGPEARVDMRTAVLYGARMVIAPMCESRYAVENFKSAAKEMCPDVELGLNIETYTMAQTMKEDWFKGINHITIGRSDLCHSLQQIKRVRLDSVEMYALCTAIQEKIGACTLSVGGGMTPKSARLVYSLLKPETINTRHCVIIANDDVERNVKAALEWESELYRNEAEKCRKAFNLARSVESMDRAQK